MPLVNNEMQSYYLILTLRVLKLWTSRWGWGVHTVRGLIV